MPRKTKTPKMPATAPGQPYGMAGQQVAAMDVVPIANTANNYLDQPVDQATVQSEMMPVGANPEFNTNVNSLLEAAVNSPTPQQGAFSAPSERPEETFQNMTPMPASPQTQTNPTIETLKLMAQNMGNDPALLEMVNILQTRGY